MQPNFIPNFLYYLPTNLYPTYGQVPFCPNLSPFSYTNLFKMPQNQLEQINSSASSPFLNDSTIDKMQISQDLGSQNKSPKQSFLPFEKVTQVTNFAVSPKLSGNFDSPESIVSISQTNKSNNIITTVIRSEQKKPYEGQKHSRIQRVEKEGDEKIQKRNNIIDSPHLYYSTLLSKIDKDEKCFETTDNLIRKMLVKDQKSKLNKKLKQKNKQRKKTKMDKSNSEQKNDSNSSCSSKPQIKNHKIKKNSETNLKQPNSNKNLISKFSNYMPS